jgi:hypothetical protein
VSIFAPTPPPRTLILEEEGTALPLRSRIDVQGAGATVTDDPANNQLILSIPGGGGSATVPFINVKTDYGAVGDGVANDTAAIQAALTAGVGGAGGSNNAYATAPPAQTVVFPPGTYLVDPLAITVPHSCTMRIRGEGRAELRQRAAYSPATTPILQIAGAGFPTESRIEISNLEINGLGTSAAKGLRLLDLAYASVHNVFAYSCSTAFDLWGCLVNVFYNCHAYGNQGIVLSGNFLGAATNQSIFYGCCVRSGEGGGVLSRGGGGHKWLNCTIEANGAYGIKLDNAGGNDFLQPMPAVVEGCWFEGNEGPGVLVGEYAPLSIIRGCYFYDRAGATPAKPLADRVEIEANRRAPTIIEQNTFDTRSASAARTAIVNNAGSHQVRVERNVLRGPGAIAAVISNSGTGLTTSDNFLL